MRASGNNTKNRCKTRLCLGALLLALALPGSAFTATRSTGEHSVEDLDYGRALFQFFQQHELGAITQLLISEQRPRSRRQKDESDLLLADLYYGYGLFNESQQMFARLLDAETSDSIQNRIWFNLARLNFEQGNFDLARDLLSRINSRLPAAIEAERKYLLTSLLLGKQQYDDAADLSNSMEPQSIWKIYARYNLAVSLIEADGFEQGKFLLDQIGQIQASSDEHLALRDQANLALGLKLLRMQQPQAALDSLSRIRLQGPLSNEALLASGWAWYRLDQFDKALVPWWLLLRNNAIDAPTQEAILAIPTNYAKLGKDKLAIRYYENAADQFQAQLGLLDAAIESIQQDGLIASLREHAILFDRASLQRLPPSSDVTPQLHLFMASATFQSEVKRYQQLIDIRNSLNNWGVSFPALELMLAERRRGFELKLPLLRQSSSFESLASLQERRDQFASRLSAIESSEDFFALADLDEAEHIQRLERVAASIKSVSAQRNTAYQADMHRLLSGLLRWNIETEYPGRFWKAKKQLIGLDRALEESQQRAASLRRISEFSALQFDDFDARIAGQQARILQLELKVSGLLKRQEKQINQLAIAAIQRQQQHILQLRLDARYQLAKLYDKLAAQP